MMTATEILRGLSTTECAYLLGWLASCLDGGHSFTRADLDSAIAEMPPVLRAIR